MEADAAGGTEPVTAGAWAPSKVAELLGVSPVTLRSWSARYGIGPSGHDDGRHRRYSDDDVRRLRHMRRLIDRGMRAREAAAVAFSGPGEAAPELPPARRAGELAEAAEQVEFDSIAALLDETLAALGVARTWTEVLLPVLRNLGGRWLRGEDCFASEWALTSEVSLALERHSRRLRAAVPGRPVLLACCPGERHTLPVEVLRAALLEVGVPALYLGSAVPAETTAELAAKLDPVLVVLWSMSPATADDVLLRRLERAGFAMGLAGPGWERPADRNFPWVDDLAAALDLAAEHAGR